MVFWRQRRPADEEPEPEPGPAEPGYPRTSSWRDVFTLHSVEMTKDFRALLRYSLALLVITCCVLAMLVGPTILLMVAGLPTWAAGTVSFGLWSGGVFRFSRLFRRSGRRAASLPGDDREPPAGGRDGIAG